MRQGEGPGDQRLGSDDRGQRGHGEEGIEERTGRQEVERILERPRHAQNEGTLAEVVEEERRQRDEEPGEPDRTPPEVAHVGVERLRPGDGQHDGPQDEKPRHPVVHKHLRAVPGIEGKKDLRRPRNLSSIPAGRKSCCAT